MLPQLDTTYYLSSVFWLFLCFGFMFLFVRFWLLPKVKNIKHERNNSIESKLKYIKNIREKISELDDDFAKQMVNIRESLEIEQKKRISDFDERSNKIVNETSLACDKMLRHEKEKIEKESKIFSLKKKEIANEIADIFISNISKKKVSDKNKSI